MIDSRGVNLFNPIQLYWSIAHTHLVCSMVRLNYNAISLFKAPNCELIRSLTVWHHPYVVQITQNKFKQLLFNSEVTKRCECPLLNLLFSLAIKNENFFIFEVYEFTRGRCQFSRSGEIRPNQIKVNLTNKHSSSPLHHRKSQNNKAWNIVSSKTNCWALSRSFVAFHTL